MKTPQSGKSKPFLFSKKKEDIKSDGKHIFVYIRRSTTNKQELSLQRQDDNAKETIIQAGFNPNDVEYYIESKSAYAGVKVKDGNVMRRRTEFTRMLGDIDKSPVPVILLTYEDSRLSRNDPDTNEILARLFGEYEKDKCNIDKIIFNGGEIWTGKSNKGDIKQRLLDRYKESLKISERSHKANLRELRNQRYILSTPVGINRLSESEKGANFRGLVTNEKMPIILKAWEMKSEYKSKREIDNYLKKYGIELRETHEKYFRKHVYMGYHVDPENGDLLPIKFASGKPPIPEKLWYKVQETLGVRRVSKYGDKQEGDILSYLLKWEEDTKKSRSFSVEFPKGKYKSYKSNAYGGFNKSETKIIKEFLPQAIGKIADLFYGLSELHKTINSERLAKLPELKSSDGKIRILVKKSKKELLSENLEKRTNLISINSIAEEEMEIKTELQNIPIWVQDIGEVKEGEIFNSILKSLNTDNFVKALDLRKRMSYIETIKNGRKTAEEQLKISLTTLGNQESFKERDKRIIELQKLQKEKVKKEQQRADTPMELAALRYPYEYVEKTLAGIDEEIIRLDKDIEKLSQNSNIEEFLDEIPEVLTKIFELCSKALSNKEISAIKDEVTKLVEITTFELSVSTKKELKVKLFDGLEDVLKLKNEEWLPELDSNQGPTG